MLIAEYDYDEDIRVQRQEAMEEGAEKTSYKHAIIMHEEGLPNSLITKVTGLDEETLHHLFLKRA